jgi:hypothetical protein
MNSYFRNVTVVCRFNDILEKSVTPKLARD